MVRLTDAELDRKIIREAHQLYGGEKIGDLFANYGADAFIEKEYDPDEWFVYKEREETDDEYNRRINTLKIAYANQEKFEKERKEKQEKADRRTYLRLKKKFEGK